LWQMLMATAIWNSVWPAYLGCSPVNMEAIDDRLCTVCPWAA
jgi:hypothetical protein